MRKSSVGTIDNVKFKIPNTLLIFKDDASSDKQVLINVLTYFCGYTSKKAIAKVLEIQNKGEAVVFTGTKETVEDLYSLINDFCIYNEVYVTMDIREER